MTEAEWLASDDPARMLRFATHQDYNNRWHHNAPSDRKLRLFACACWRREPPRHANWYEFLAAVKQQEELADGLRQYFWPELINWVPARYDASDLIQEIIYDLQRHLLNESVAAALLRDILGNPFRDHGGLSSAAHLPHWFGWPEGLAVQLAQAAYHECLPDGTLDPVRLLVLADALEEAGCDNIVMLGHLRGEWECWGAGITSKKPIRHIRGCWVVDLLLGKE
jgi:hypothetical protein